MITPSVRTFLTSSLSLGALAACAVSAPDTPPVVVDTPPVVEEAAPPVVQKAETAAPEKLAIDAERIAALESAMADYIRDGRLYGVHTRLAQKGEVVSDYYVGIRGLESGAPIESDTIYRIYSMSKPITGVAMMMLWEEGKFQLDDPITTYVPEFENLKVLGRWITNPRRYGARADHARTDEPYIGLGLRARRC